MAMHKVKTEGRRNEISPGYATHSLAGTKTTLSLRYGPDVSSEHGNVTFKNGKIAAHFEAPFPSVLKGIILVHGPLSQGSFL